MEITLVELEEVLDKRFNKFGQEMDKKMDQKLAAQSKELKAHAESLQEELAQMVGDGFIDVIARLDVRKRVDKLEEKMAWNENKVQI